jgi:hypothetical protein
MTPEQRAWLLDTYEAVFQHQRFTGRSGSMYKYEGLGCIYWHMVSKLALAVAEAVVEAARSGADPELIDGLSAHYRKIREGLGLHKSPADYGAFPTDPYSHTPGFAGVQQPGLTGQVKEDVIARFTQLGVRVREGIIEFAPVLMEENEFLRAASTWKVIRKGQLQSIELARDSFAFTLCGVPIIYRLADTAQVEVVDGQGSSHRLPGNALRERWSEALRGRQATIDRVLVDVPRSLLRQGVP